MTRTTGLAPLLERFFTQRLMQQRQASPHTITSYRDTFRQFLIFAHQRLARPPSRLAFEQIDAPLIIAFLEELETRRGLSVRSRNLRLTAIHSFFRYGGVRAADPRSADPESARDSEQAIHAQAGQLSQPPGDRCVACSTGSKDMVGTTRPRLHPHRGANGASAVRDDRTQTRGLRVGKRRSPARRRKGPQGALYAAGKTDPCRSERLAARAPARRQRRALSQRQRRTADRPWGSVPVEQAPRHSLNEMPLVETSAGDCPPLAPHRGHGPSSGRRRSRGDRLVARTRIGRDHADLSRGDAGNERTCSRQDNTPNRQAKPLPAR